MAWLKVASAIRRRARLDKWTMAFVRGLRLNPHLYAIVLDGVFAAIDAAPVFHPLTNLDTSDLADLLQVIQVRVLSFLERRGVIESRHELTLLDDGFADREPTLFCLITACVSSRVGHYG